MARKLSGVSHPFIKIQFGQVSLTRSFIGGHGARPDFFTSLSHKRYVDKANTCSINVSYAPPADNPNALEAAIVNSRGLCTFQYGIEGYKSKTYKGLVYDYRPSFSEGYLNYEFSLISQSVTTSSDTVMSYRFSNDNDENYQMPAREFLARLEHWIDKKGYFKSQYGEIYKFSQKLSDHDFHLPAGGIWGYNLTPLAALQDMATKFISNNGDEVKYRLVIDDSVDGPSAGCIYFKKEGEVVADFNFDWNSKNSDVLSWSPSFQGSAAIFFARGEALNENGPIKKTIVIGSSNGEGTYEKIDTSGINKDNAVRFLSESRTVLGNSTSDLKWFYDAAKYPYKANLVTLGRPEVELVKTYVNVRPHINGYLHHSAGKYMVVGITDTVDNSGFTTSLDLVKMDNLDEIYKMGYSLQNFLSSNENKPGVVIKPGRNPASLILMDNVDMEY